MSKLVALILGAGPGIGKGVAAGFSDKGYQVVTTSRSGTDKVNEQGWLSLKHDLNDISSIPDLFSTIKKQFSTAPSVVVFNAAALTVPADRDSLLSVPVPDFAKDLNLNVVSPYAVAKQTVEHWKEMDSSTPKTFIFTGNYLFEALVRDLPGTEAAPPAWLNLGVGKAASAFWVGYADASYSKKGYRFYFADERNADGSPVGGKIDGEAAKDFYVHLASNPSDVPWQATFVKSKGYVSFK